MIVCPLLFLAGMVDSIAGGGGVVSISALLLAGFPVHVALGTNKAAMSCGTLVATLRYAKAGKMDVRAAVCAALGAILGAIGGTKLALMVSDRALTIAMLCVLPAVAVWLLFKRDLGGDSARDLGYSPRKAALIALCIGLGCGCYDGMIGPGTGTFMTLCFTGFLGLDLLCASGCARTANLFSGIGSLLIFGLGGKVLWALALPAALCAMLGGAVGSGMALKGGARVIRATIFVVLLLMLVKMAYELAV